MQVAFLVLSNVVSNHKYSTIEPNPGIGGTQFSTIQIAALLAEQNPGWKISLVNQKKINIENCPANLSTFFSVDAEEFVKLYNDNFDVVIAPVCTLEGLKYEVLKTMQGKLIAWSHHPYDFRVRQLDGMVKLAAIVSVGLYQYHSNSFMFSAPRFLINNIFPYSERYQGTFPSWPQDKQVKIAHLGALVEEKGFLHIANQWPSIKKSFPEAELHIIGSGALYRETEIHPLIPTSLEFAKKVLAAIPEEDINSGKVVFYGNRGADKFDILAKCHVAIQNPTGASEAFPASTLECMSLGIPVIGGDDYGMWDFMRYFPKLSLKSSSDIVPNLNFLFSGEKNYLAMSEKAKNTALGYANKNNIVLDNWIALINHVKNDNVNSAILKQDLSVGIPRSHFIKRIISRYWKMILSNTMPGKLYRKCKRLFA